MKDTCGDKLTVESFDHHVYLEVDDTDRASRATAELTPKLARKLARKLCKAADEAEA